MKTTVFEATKSAVVINEETGTVVVRDGLTPKQAKQLAAQLTRQASDAEEYKPTRREQKFIVKYEGEFEFTSMEDAEEFNGLYTASEMQKNVKDYLSDMDPVEGVYDTSKNVKVTVTKVYDKQVPNE